MAAGEGTGQEGPDYGGSYMVRMARPGCAATVESVEKRRQETKGRRLSIGEVLSQKQAAVRRFFQAVDEVIGPGD